MGAEQALKRIPRIKFPQRHPKPSASGDSGSIPERQAIRKDGDIIDSFITRSRSDVPAPPINTAVGGKASLLPKRTPVTEREIEAILVRKMIFLKVYLRKCTVLGSGLIGMLLANPLECYNCGL